MSTTSKDSIMALHGSVTSDTKNSSSSTSLESSSIHSTTTDKSSLHAYSIQQYIADNVHYVPYKSTVNATHNPQTQVATAAEAGHRMSIKLQEFDKKFQGGSDGSE
ncbi:603ac3a6-0ccd-4ef1-8d41-9bb16036dd19 [Sclerotinia trifoliorum]|uniref:603ac3a6-0ccd-4ef1-8d41-9bb16036dd19 n=1 Tax=Sclerotinia trifoliorum TaxID=28548 RepID=A0A8H2W6H5_9HELO|nr:603ac3a6-0ccd-4ef1-8d41-9bb16036dd19 [Sclerotinia trifoliorum]